MTNQPPYDPNDPALHAAINEAEALVQRMHGGDLTPAFEVLDEALPKYEQETGYTVDSLIPPLEEPTGLGFSLSDLRQGRVFAALVLCDTNHDVRTAIDAAVTGGVPALVPVIATILVGGAAVIPIAVFAIAGGVAAVVMVRGIKGFCRDCDRSLSG